MQITTDSTNNSNATASVMNTSSDQASANELVNAESPINAVGLEYESYTKTKLGSGKPIINQGEQNVLGLRWNTATDCFLFDLKSLVENAKNWEPTKRNETLLVWYQVYRLRPCWIPVANNNST
jgi:hypothetical protein